MGRQAIVPGRHPAGGMSPVDAVKVVSTGGVFSEISIEGVFSKVGVMMMQV